ncbi:mannitol dehydrogenase family protein [Pseudomonas sp. DC3000-4b1]|uniref:mannitol dehydrogenase family protein n=1 Tax=unclassified Pseudomonas TaxID=196821 RepID=UPI003CE9EBE9
MSATTLAATGTPILQFGTSRFLQAHADLFISEALVRGQALGRVTVVQTTDNPGSAERVKALASGEAYPVRIQGIEQGRVIDELRWSTSIAGALRTAADWPLIRALFVRDTQVVLSNTGDAGYALSDLDTSAALAPGAPAPASFPAKLLVLLHDRWQANPSAMLSLFPCELVPRNGEVLRELVLSLARGWALAPSFITYLHEGCRWANSLVDRIVSQAIEPVGAVAEPYALWAIERQEGLLLPCKHPSMIVTDRLDRYEHFKLFMLNLGHSWLAERWHVDGRAADETVHQAMQDPALRQDLESLWEEEVLPVFAAQGCLAEAMDYLASVRERFLNPYLRHRIADIAQNHEQKKCRRFLPLVKMSQRLSLDLSQPRLMAALGLSGIEA